MRAHALKGPGPGQPLLPTGRSGRPCRVQIAHNELTGHPYAIDFAQIAQFAWTVRAQTAQFAWTVRAHIAQFAWIVRTQIDRCVWEEGVPIARGGCQVRGQKQRVRRGQMQKVV